MAYIALLREYAAANADITQPVPRARLTYLKALEMGAHSGHPWIMITNGVSDKTALREFVSYLQTSTYHIYL